MAATDEVNFEPKCILYNRDVVSLSIPLWWGFASLFRTRSQLEAENLVLRHQLAVLRRSAPRSPWQNAYVERLIGSIRRECLDHVIVFDEKHLRRLLRTYADYYNALRTHLSLGQDAPSSRPARSTGRITRIPQLGGLHNSFVRI